MKYLLNQSIVKIAKVPLSLWNNCYAAADQAEGLDNYFEFENDQDKKY